MRSVFAVFRALTGAQVRRRIYIALTLLLCTSITSATTWQVPGDFPYLQTAIYSISVVNGDTIELTAALHQDWGHYHNITYSGKAITIRSRSGNPDLCVINCLGQGRGFVFISGEGAGSILEGITITNGLASDGGGVYCAGYSRPTIVNCTIRNNIANNNGGGVFCHESWPTFTNCTISDNSAVYDGGGVCCWLNSSPTFTNCTINDNSAVNNGGGVCCYSPTSPIFTNCLISNNVASGDAGGAYCMDYSYPTFRNCTISSNIAQSSGGGVYCGISNSQIIKNCILWSNAPDQIYNSGGSPQVTYSDVEGGWPGNENINSDPLFIFGPGPYGDYYLSQVAAGQTQQSPCVDTGDPSSEIIEGTTRTNGVQDDYPVDMGYHYEVFESLGYMTLLSSGPPDWAYRLNWISGYLDSIVFANFCDGTIGSVGGVAAASWTAANYADSIVFTASIPLTSGSIDTFWLSHPWCDDVVDWTVGDSSGSVDGPLPVELTTFQAVGGDGQVTLQWRTESELDNDHFLLYKRKTGEEDFHALTEIPGHGTTAEPHDYQFVDSWVQNGIAYDYQISDVDIAGRETFYEQIVSATPGRDAVPTEFALYPNYPNPFNPVTTIRYDVKETGLVSLKIFDLLGREVTTLTHEEHSAGAYSMTWDAAGMPSGIYLARMEAEGFAQVRKLLLVK